jgi:hypothetical protein
MAVYGAARFDTLIDDAGRVPYLERAGGVSVTPIPYAGADHVQFARAGSPTLTLAVSLSSDADYASLSAYLGDGVPRLLEDPFGWGENLDAMCLTAFSARRLAWAPDWEGEATFIRVGSAS